MIRAIKEGRRIKELDKSHPARAFRYIWEEAGVEDTMKGEVIVFNSRVFIPASLREHFLKLLHSSHMSAEKMWKTVREIWAWPGLKNDINQMTQNYSTCSDWARSKVSQASI